MVMGMGGGRGCGRVRHWERKIDRCVKYYARRAPWLEASTYIPLSHDIWSSRSTFILSIYVRTRMRLLRQLLPPSTLSHHLNIPFIYRHVTLERYNWKGYLFELSIVSTVMFDQIKWEFCDSSNEFDDIYDWIESMKVISFFYLA